LADRRTKLSTVKKTVFLFIITIIIFSFGVVVNIAAADPVKVLILPFTINSDKDLSFLRKGVADMLSSRLALKDQIVVIDKTDSALKQEQLPEEIDADTALAVGERTRSNYVLFGSLTVFGDTISTDARFFDVGQKQPVLTFSELGNTQGEVISHINLLASRIKEEVFGQKTIAAQPPPPPTSAAKKSEDVSRTHPEKLLDRASGEAAIISEDVSEAREAAAVLWKTHRFKAEIKGMALGDVDGDTKNEIVFISKNVIFIYRYTDGRFGKIAEIQGETVNTYIGIDVADINDNGRSEIFVTNLSDDNRIRSFVLEWNGTEFKTVVETENWHYRVINASDRGRRILLGQKGGFEEIFLGRIHELIWENGRYVSADKERLPRRMNVYGFTYGDVLANGQESVLALTRNGTLRILDSSGNEEWTSSDTYGGSNIYLLSPADKKAATRPGYRTDPSAGKGIYLQQRIFVADLDEDKKKEVIVVKNHDAVSGALMRYRSYSGGHFEALVWDNVGFRKKWKTRKFSGYISDYDVGDFYNNGTDELVFALVVKTDSVFKEPRSHIVTLRLKN
jgi:TolB-like protein